MIVITSSYIEDLQQTPLIAKTKFQLNSINHRSKNQEIYANF